MADFNDPWIGDAAEQMRSRVVARRRPSSSALDRPPYDSAPEWAARWGETAPPIETVLQWRSVSGDLVGVALCVGDDEWLTTVESVRGGRISFASLAALIGNLPADVLVGWREIPTVAARPAGDAAVKDWASQFLAPQAPATSNLVGDAVKGER